jgi:hypothetical protein
MIMFALKFTSIDTPSISNYKTFDFSRYVDFTMYLDIVYI